jgi:hypothetical protein
MRLENIHNTVKNIVTVVRGTTDSLLENAIEFGKQKAQTTIENLRKRTQKNIRNTIFLDAGMLMLLIVLYFMHPPKALNLIGIVVVNLVVLGRLVLKIIDFIKTVYKPYYDIIQCALPSALSGIKKLSLSTAIKNAICSVFDLLYETKIPQQVKTGITIAGLTGTLKPINEIRKDVSVKFYPIIKKYIIELFVFNFLIFSVCYGVVVFFTRRFFLSHLLYRL